MFDIEFMWMTHAKKIVIINKPKKTQNKHVI